MKTARPVMVGLFYLVACLRFDQQSQPALLEVVTDLFAAVLRAELIKNIDVDTLVDAFGRPVSHREVT